MKKQQLNELVLAYQNGNELALNEIFNEVNPMIERASREVEPYMEDFTKFDCQVIRDINRIIKTFDAEKHDFFAAVKGTVTRYKARFIKRNSRKRNEDVYMSAIEGKSDDELGYQFESNENTESDVLFQEKVDLLAQDDERKETILLQWSKGVDDDKSISALLAQRFGGKAESHRKFIQRFRTDCRNRLATEMA